MGGIFGSSRVHLHIAESARIYSKNIDSNTNQYSKHNGDKGLRNSTKPRHGGAHQANEDRAEQTNREEQAPTLPVHTVRGCITALAFITRPAFAFAVKMVAFAVAAEKTSESRNHK